MRPFAAQVIAESLRLAQTDWQPGDELPLAPLDDATVAAREARLDIEAALESERAARDRRWRARQAVAADPALRAQLAELVGPPGGSDEGSRDTPATAAPAHNLDAEGFSQRTIQTSRFSQQTIPSLAHIVDGTLALEPVDRPAPAPGIHAGHGCCRDETLPYGTMTLVGRRTVYDADEEALTFTKEREAIAIDASCNRWRCPCCKWRLRKRNRARAIRGALRPQGRTWFITITLDRSTELYREFRAAELVGDRTTIQVDRKRRRRPVDVRSIRIVRKPRLIGPGQVPAARLLGRHRGVIEPGGRILEDGNPQAETLISVRYQAQAWNRLRLMLERHFGHRVEYYKALELHPGGGANDGIAHLHLLVRTASVAEWWMRFQGAGSWRSLLARAGFGVVTKVELVKSREDAARYVTKMTAAYTSKDMAELPRWTRRGAWSRDWSTWDKPTRIAGEWHWQLARGPLDGIREALVATGFALLDASELRAPP